MEAVWFVTSAYAARFALKPEAVNSRERLGADVVLMRHSSDCDVLIENTVVTQIDGVESIA